MFSLCVVGVRRKERLPPAYLDEAILHQTLNGSTRVTSAFVHVTRVLGEREPRVEDGDPARRGRPARRVTSGSALEGPPSALPRPSRVLRLRTIITKRLYSGED